MKNNLITVLVLVYIAFLSLSIQCILISQNL